MDIRDIRQANLRFLIKQLAGDDIPKFAVLAGMNEAYLRQLLMNRKMKTSRAVGNRTARKLEKFADLPHGSMDSVISLAQDQAEYELRPGAMLIQQIIEQYTSGTISDSDLESIVAFTEFLKSKNENMS